MQVKERFRSHVQRATQGDRPTYKIYNAMNKYGCEHFYVETLEEGIPLDELDEKEIEYISLYNSFENGYNSTRGGDGRIINKLYHEDDILEMASQGVIAKEIANKYGVNKATIFRTLHKLGFYYHVDKEAIINYAKSGLSNKEIAELLSCSTMTVSRALDKKGMRKHALPFKKRKDLEDIKRDYKAGVDAEDVCSKYNIRPNTYKKMIKYFNSQDSLLDNQGVTTIPKGSREEDELPPEVHNIHVVDEEIV